MRGELVCLALALAAAPQEPEDAGPLLKRDGWKAVRAFVLRGEAARGALDEAAASKDPDVAFFAAAARSELDFLAREKLRAAAAPAFDGPALEAAEAVFAAAGLDFEGAGLPVRKVSLPAGLSPAEAVERLGRETDVEFVPRSEGAWSAEGKHRKIPRFASGRTLAALTQARRWSSRELGRGEARSLSFAGEFRYLARLSRPILFADLRVLEAVDDRGADLRGNPKEAGFHLGEDPDDLWAVFDLSLRPLSPGASRIARLRFAADLALAGERADLSFPLGAGGLPQKRTAGDLTASLKRAFREEEVYRLELEVRGRALHRRLTEDGVRLLDKDGKAWAPAGRTGSTGQDEVDWEFAFRNPNEAGEPVRLVCSVIGDSIPATLHFEIPGFEVP
jgi:hypothetical protein